MKINHEIRVYILLAALLTAAIVYVYLITFLPIPKENIRFADTALGFFLGTLISAIISYYTGASPRPNKPGETSGTTTAEFTASVTTEPVTDKPE